MNFGKLPKYHVGKIPPYTVHWEYLLIKTAALAFYMKCLEIQVATSSMVN